MKLQAYSPVFNLPASGQAIHRWQAWWTQVLSRTMTFTTALDIHSFLPAVQTAGQIGIKN